MTVKLRVRRSTRLVLILALVLACVRAQPRDSAPVDRAPAVTEPSSALPNVRVEPGDPWQTSSEDYDRSCYLGDGAGVLETRVVFTGPAGTVDVLEWDGESHPHAARVVGSEAFAQGALVSATATVTVLGPEIRYRARSDGSCKLPEYETEPPVRFGAGDDVFCFAADEGNLDCESGDVDWLVAHDGWLEPDPQDDAEHRSARECLAALLESVPLDAAADVYTGWWIRLDDGWVHADDRFTLEIKCDECEGEHDRCVEGCTDAACTKQCDEALADCEPPWRRHPPG